MEKYIIKRSQKETEQESEDKNNGNEPSNQSAAYTKETDTKISRKFRDSWLHEFSWLKVQNGKAYCGACEKTLISHLTHLRKHETSSNHIQNLKHKQNQIGIDEMLNNETRSLKNQVRLAELSLVMFCIQHKLPFLLMDFMPQLLVECCPDSAIAKALRCGRTKSTQIAEVLGNKALEKILPVLRSKKFSLILDETTDISTQKALVLIVRYVDTMSRCVRDRFLGLLELPKSDATTIFLAIKDFFVKHEIPLSNLIGLATDGASVMSGDLNGLKAKFKNETELFYMKCTCHSLHLCSSYACKKLPLEVEKLCRNIYKFFSHSASRINAFKEFQEYCSVKPHKILGISHTRWLSIEAVINRVIEQWDSLRLYFISCYIEVDGIGTADLANSMNPETKTYFLFLSYILNTVNNLNKEFQSEQVRIPYLYSQVEANFKLILSHFMKNHILRNINCLSKVDLNDTNNYLPIADIFVGLKAENYLKNSELTMSQTFKIKSDILSFYLELLQQIKSRFDFANDNLKMLSIITPQKVLSESEISILPLVTKFPYLINGEPDKVIAQWNFLRMSQMDLSVNMDINSFWEKISFIKNGLNENCFDELCSFVFNIFSLPHSSAAAERKFSELALIKTKTRNKLQFATLNNVMLAAELSNSKTNDNIVWSAKSEF